MAALVVMSPCLATAARAHAPNRVVLFEPCAQQLAHGSAQVAAQGPIVARPTLFERIAPGAGVAGWLELLAHPPAALYVHTVGDSHLIVVACFATQRSRDFALEALDSDPRTRSLVVEPRTHGDGRHRVWMIATPFAPGAAALRAAGTVVYWHIANGSRSADDTGTQRGADPTLSPPLVNQRALASRYFRRHLADIQAIGNGAPANATSSNVRDRPDISITPRACRVTAPFAELPIRLRNVGGAALGDPRLTMVLGPEGIRVRGRDPLPPTIAPATEVQESLSIGADSGVPAGEYPLVYAVGGRVEGRSRRDRRGFYDAFGDLRVVIDHPPQITAPSSVEFSFGDSVALGARDPDDQPIHFEALLPPGVDLHLLGAGRAELRFADYDFPATPVSEVVLVAWSGDDRDTARARTQRIEIVGGDVGPTPWIPLGAYGAVLAMLLAAYVQHRIYARRRVAEDG